MSEATATAQEKVTIKAVLAAKYWLKRQCFVRNAVYKVSPKLAAHLLAQEDGRGRPFFVRVALMDEVPVVSADDHIVVDVENEDTGAAQVKAPTKTKKVALPSFNAPEEPPPMPAEELKGIELEQPAKPVSSGFDAIEV